MNKRNIGYKYQFGFRKAPSTSMARITTVLIKYQEPRKTKTVLGDLYLLKHFIMLTVRYYVNNSYNRVYVV